MKRAFWPLLLLCAAVGLVGRLWNIDFDQRQHLPPDERFWTFVAADMDRLPAPAAHGTAIGPVLDWLDGQRSPASPYRATESFLYGPISLATARAAAGWLHDGAAEGDQPAAAVVGALDGVGLPLLEADGEPRFDSGYGVDLIGRMLGAVFDTMTIVVVGLIGRRLGGRTAGLAAAALYAGSVLAIQHAHYLGAEPLLGLGCALTVLAALRLDRGGDWRRALTSGAALGAAAGFTVAAKLTGVGLVMVPFVGCAALLIRHRRRSDLVRLGAVGLGAAIGFRVFNPAAFNGLGLSLSTAFLDDIRRASELAESTAPPSFQWANRTPIVQPLVWLGVFTVGPGVVLAAGFGLIAMSTRLFGQRLGGWLRRWMPGMDSLMTNVGRWPLLVVGAAAVTPFTYIVITSLPTGRYFIPMLPGLYAIAGLGIAAALRVTRRSVGLDRLAAGGFAAVSLGLAAVWGLAFVNGVYGGTNTRIQASHWIAENVKPGSTLSSQVWDDALPMRLPGIDTAAFVGLSFDMVGPDDVAKVITIADQIGEVDYVIESSPRISAAVTRIPVRFPSTINFFEGLDDGSLGFERVATFRGGLSLGPWQLDDRSADEAFSVNDHAEVRIWKKVRAVDRADILEVLDPIAAANAVPVDPLDAHANGLMLTADEVATNASGPTYDESFDDEADIWHVIGFFVLLELFGLAAFALLLPLLRFLPDAGLGLAKIAALVTMAFAVFVATAWLRVDLDRGLVAAIAAAFVFGGLVAARRHRVELRELWRTRRATLVAAEAIGAVVFVALILLRGLNPDLWHPDRGGEKPFELALLTAVLRTKTFPVYDPWFAGGSLNYYSGGWFLLGVPARILRTSPTLVMNIGLATLTSCAASAVFSLSGGLLGRRADRRRPARRLTDRRRVNHLRANRQGLPIVAGVLAVVLLLVTSNLAVVLPAWRTVLGTPGVVDWWAMSRVIPDSIAITEFPAWSLLFGDLHPHVMGLAVLFLYGGMCLAWHRSLVGAQRRHAIVLGVLVGMTLGTIRMTNTWDFPLAIGLAALVVLGAIVAKVSWTRLVAPVAAAAFVAVLVWSPYTRRGLVFDSGVDPATLRTPPRDWLEQFGLFAAVAVVMIAMVVPAAVGSSRAVLWRIRNGHVVLLGTAMVGLGWLALRPTFGVLILTSLLMVGCGWCAWVARRSPDRSSLGPAAMAIGWSVQAGVELFTVRNDGGRLNTVFKFWFESWAVLAVGTAVVLAEQLWHHHRMVRRAATWAVTIACLCGVAFWWVATPVRVDDRISGGGLSLDGEAYLSDGFVIGVEGGSFTPADDLPLVNWLRANVAGIRVIAEAPGVDYRWTGRISWLTGLPTPVGWTYHESQQRRAYGQMIETRRLDLTKLYTTTDPVVSARILAQYSVAYVVFGTQEQLLATPQSTSALRESECLTVRTESNALFVAEVDAACVTRLGWSPDRLTASG